MEQYNVVLMAAAEMDILDAVRYISTELEEPHTAERILTRIDETIVSLEFMPERYGLVKDNYLAGRGFHATTVGNYTVFYRVNHAARRVSISRVLYARRDWQSILKEQDGDESL